MRELPLLKFRAPLVAVMLHLLLLAGVFGVGGQDWPTCGDHAAGNFPAGAQVIDPGQAEPSPFFEPAGTSVSPPGSVAQNGKVPARRSEEAISRATACVLVLAESLTDPALRGCFKKQVAARAPPSEPGY